MTRRLPALVVIVAAFVAVVYGARDRLDAGAPTFSVSASGWMPSAPPPGGVTETWFCPGVPATGRDDVGGEIVIANRNDQRMLGTVLLMNEDGETRRLDLDVDGWSTARVDLDERLPGEMVAAVVEVDGGGAVVEQWAINPSGDSQAGCANATSDTWYFADGFTVDGSLDQIVLTNPYEQTVVANLSFATREGSRQPASYRGLTIPAQSVRVIDLGAPGAGAQSEPLLAVSVETARGRLVVGRSQRFLGGGRLGTQVTLGSPALRNQWWFANGARGDSVTTQYSIYNPTDASVDVDVVFLGIDLSLASDPVEPLTVPPRQLVTVDPDDYDTSQVPTGRHAAVFATSDATSSIVVERAVTRTDGDQVGTSVIGGAPPRQDGYLATTWHVASGPPEPVEAGLVIYNADNLDGTVSVSAVGSSGPVPVPGLQDLPLGAASLRTIDLTDPLVVGRELVIESTARIFVERAYPIGRGDLRASSWALPAA